MNERAESSDSSEAPSKTAKIDSSLRIDFLSEFIAKETELDAIASEARISEEAEPLIRELTDSAALKPYLENPEQLNGRLAADVESEFDERLVQKGHWEKSRSRDGNGIRYLDGKGGCAILNSGYAGGDILHQGSYVKLQPGNIRVALHRQSSTGLK